MFGTVMNKIRMSSIAALLTYSVSGQTGSLDDLKNLSLEEFSNLDVMVTSLSRKPQKLTDSAAAVYVIDQQDIKRSGATNIPEALRLAPGIEVARINASTWSVTARGSSGRFARRLLVLMDGRTIYTPVFSGVYWDVQDTVLEDIDRIEVIRGPATAVWGGNATNGVINIITKSARDTQGGLVTASVGNEVERQVALRYGDKIEDDFHYRVYAKHKKNDSSVDINDQRNSFDENDLSQLGFRAEWTPSTNNSWELRGDVYNGQIEQHQPVAVLTPTPGVMDVNRENQVSGFNILGKRTHHYAADASWSLQAYFDRARRQDTATVDIKVDTVDIDFKHQFKFAERHQVIWGMGYRRVLDDLQGKLGISFMPRRRQIERENFFFQDEISIIPDKFSVIIGSQFEHNDFTGNEIQPNIRAKWHVDETSLVWGSVSRGLGIPDRSAENVRVNVRAAPGAPPLLVAYVGNESMTPEEIVAYEFGYRTLWGKGNLFDIALFYNDYSDLRTNELGTPFVETTPAPLHIVQPLVLGDDKDGEAYGIEIAAEWIVDDKLTLKGHYSYFELDLTPSSTSTAPTPELAEGLSPQHQVSLQTQYQVTNDLTFDTWWRYVDELPTHGINNYVNLDIRLGWQATKDIELSLVGQNLLEGARLEYIDDLISNAPTQVERGVYLKGTVKF